MLEPKPIGVGPQTGVNVGDALPGKGGDVSGTRDVGGAKPNFLKALGQLIAKPFVAFGKMIASLGHKPPALSPETRAALNEFLALRRQEAAQPGSVTAEQMKAARDKAHQALNEELFNSPLYKAAEESDNDRPNVFSCKDKHFHSGSSCGTLRTASWMIMDKDRLEKFLGSGLSVTEFAAIHVYTQGAYVAINAEVRTGNETPLMQEMRKAIESGLEKLPPFRPGPGETGMVYRLANIPAQVDGRYKPGNVVTDPGIMSSTSNDGFDFNDGGQSHVLSIKPKEDTKGRNISWISESPQEREVAFPPGTKMKVLKRDISETPQSQPHPTQPGEVIFDKQVGVVLVEV